MFIFILNCGASEGFIKTLRAFIEPFEAPQRSMKIKIYGDIFQFSGIGMGRAKR